MVTRANLKEKRFLLIQIFELFGGLSLVIAFSLDMGLFLGGGAVLGLPCYVDFSLVAGSGGYYLVAVHRLLIVVAPLVAEHGL